MKKGRFPPPLKNRLPPPSSGQLPPPSQSKLRQPPNLGVGRGENARRPLISKRRPSPTLSLNKRKSEGNREQQQLRPKKKPAQASNPYSSASTPPPKVKNLLAVENDKAEIDFLDRPRSHLQLQKEMPKVKYQSIILEEPIEEEENVKKSSKDSSGSSKNPSTVKDGEYSSSVNYGYHPIIDFFPRYRFDASA